MSTPAPPAPEAAAPKKGKKLLLIVVCLVFTAAGAALPMVVNVQSLFAKSSADKGKDKKEAAKTAIVAFGEVVVNLSEERSQRYLRVKIAFLVEYEAEKEVTELVAKKKAAVKSAMISHLAGKSLKDVSGSAGVARMQRELLERVDDVLYHDGDSKIKSVLFEEYVVQ